MTSRAHSSVFTTFPSPSALHLPPFLYGTAWKKTQTTSLVHAALSAGFRGIDTAAQPKHYREDLVGAGIRQFAAQHPLRREELYIQTKFTSVQGQNVDDMPYDPSLPVSEQVKASIASSLHNLRWQEDRAARSDYLDCVVLHSPLPTIDMTMEAWTTLEGYHPAKIRHLGISNTDLATLEHICEHAKVKPSVVQNRFYQDTQYDVPLRAFCRQHGIMYQSFWTLGANARLLKSRAVQLLCNGALVEPEVALYALVMGLKGVVVLNGTKSHMQSDIEGIETVRQWAEEETGKWKLVLRMLKVGIREIDD